MKKTLLVILAGILFITACTAQASLPEAKATIEPTITAISSGLAPKYFWATTDANDPSASAAASGKVMDARSSCR